MREEEEKMERRRREKEEREMEANRYNFAILFFFFKLLVLNILLFEKLPLIVFTRFSGISTSTKPLHLPQILLLLLRRRRAGDRGQEEALRP